MSLECNWVDLSIDTLEGDLFTVPEPAEFPYSLSDMDLLARSSEHLDFEAPFVLTDSELAAFFSSNNNESQGTTAATTTDGTPPGVVAGTSAGAGQQHQHEFDTHIWKLVNYIDAAVKERRLKDAAQQFVAGEFRKFQKDWHLSGRTPKEVAQQLMELFENQTTE